MNDSEGQKVGNNNAVNMSIQITAKLCLPYKKAVVAYASIIFH